jgi:hypothetical protein
MGMATGHDIVLIGPEFAVELQLLRFPASVLPVVENSLLIMSSLP